MRILAFSVGLIFYFTFIAFSQKLNSIQNEKATNSELDSSNTIIPYNNLNTSSKILPVSTRNLVFNFVPTELFTGYDLQSNGTARQIWQDPVSHNKVHMAFTHSPELSVWYIRHGVYLFSNDAGQSWQNEGIIQTDPLSRGGFATINGLSDGRPVAAMHTNDGINVTRTQIYLRDTLQNNWTRFDPGGTAEGEPIWPVLQGIGNHTVGFLSSIQSAPNNNFFINSLNLSTGSFNGWQPVPGDQSQRHCLASSSDGSTLGLAFIGNIGDQGEVFYAESLDNGLTWSDLLPIYYFGEAGDSLGAFMGIDMVYLDNDPYVVFEVIKRDTATGTYYPTPPSKIILWSPAVNGGAAITIADEHNIPYFEQSSLSRASLCRPSIGKSADENSIFITINAVTEDYMIIEGSKFEYFAGYFMYSLDKGVSFSSPERFTPKLPLRDWRYISINSVNHIKENNKIKVMMAAQSDSIPGDLISPPGLPIHLTAEFFFISTDIPLQGVSPEINLLSPNGGEIWQAGTSKNITWTSSDIAFTKLELSTDNGSTWITITASTPAGGIYGWEVPNLPSSQCLVRITDNVNLSVTDLSDAPFTILGTSSVDEWTASIPNEFSLKQNFPNPFNPSTTINYGIPEYSHVSIKVFNLLGQKIAEPVNQYKEPGYYEINLSLGNQNSGLYIYKIEATPLNSKERFVKTMKMVLIK